MFEDDYKRSDSSMNRGSSNPKPWGKGSPNFKRPEGSDIISLIIINNNNNDNNNTIYIIF